MQASVGQAAHPARARRLGRLAPRPCGARARARLRARGGPRTAADAVRGAPRPRRGAATGRLRMSELARSVLLSQSGVTRLVDRLEARGLGRARAAAPRTAAGCNARITDDGRRRLAEARPTHLAGVRRLFVQHFDDDELRQLAEFWERVCPARPRSRRCRSPGSPSRIGSRREDRHRRAVLVVVLGRGGRARRAPGRGARGAWARGPARDGQRPTGSVHARPAPARRAARQPARRT